ncbi:probable E3 ubiquitin-protein ligase RNF217 [Fundulus heteroclitus]|uniref:probable E3 ubiquitin-protein ligase RNF217 n=1 Tax=Fundulus heteroclitus TaxID=8078 RepID=UPI00165B31E3|nr:probable E3 ubiquitin-protein ligase RNF217 [Fundulus heteroclitus]
MGRAKSGMEDDESIADACEMPSFMSNIEEGRGKLSRNQTTGTSIPDGEVGRPLGDLSRPVIRSKSRLSLDGRTGKRSGEGERDAEGNNNNNCNSAGVGAAGRRRRRASAVEVLRRNFGDSKSPSHCSSTKSRMQSEVEHGAGGESGNTDCKDVQGAQSGECQKSDAETGGAGGKNEPPLSESTTSDVAGVQRLTVADKCHLKAEDVSNNGASGESLGATKHVYCTVYCIANDMHGTDAEITDRHDDAAAAASDGAETDSGAVTVGDLDAEPEPYTPCEMLDPYWDRFQRLERAQAGGLDCCRVCLEEKTIASLPCCGKAVCDECLKLYVSSQVWVGKVLIGCPIPECSGTLEEGLMISHMSNEELAKYHYFLELSQLDSSTKPCPQCSHFTSLKAHATNRSEHKYKIQCSSCQFVWCFKCHAPWHEGLKCRDYRKGDKLLRTWASVIEQGQRNAQKCPKCKIHIQRTEGCDHMTCAQCNTNFCYRCGERYRHLRFFGDHTSNLSVFGCKYRYLPDKPHLRRLIRGSVCATKVLIAPLVLLLVIVLGALALVIGLFAFPVYYVCKRRKKQQQQQTRGTGQWI